MDVVCPIIKIDESLKPTHLQNNCSVLNVWLESSQKLGLRILYIKATVSLCVCVGSAWKILLVITHSLWSS
jgi:hypothetical protein